MKKKTTAALLAIFLGGLGVHKFYLKEAGSGITYLLFFWTCVPLVLGLIQGINLLSMSEDQFNRRYN